MSEFKRLEPLIEYMNANDNAFGWKSRCEALTELAESLEAELADKDKQLFEARAGAKKLRRAAKAYQELTTCYRTGGRPSEKLFKDLEKAKAIMADKEISNGDSC